MTSSWAAKIVLWYFHFNTWWRHRMETFSALLTIFMGNSPVTGEFPTQRSVTRCFNVFFDLRQNKRLSKQWWGWWFETPSCPLWYHCYYSVICHWQLWISRINNIDLWSLSCQINSNGYVQFGNSPVMRPCADIMYSGFGPGVAVFASDFVNVKILYR